jgi:hypothetical protein
MNTRTHYILALGLLVLAMLPVGCGGDGGSKGGGGGGGLKGDYEIFAGFTVEPDLGDGAPQAMAFVATVERLNSADPSAKTAVVTVDGVTIPLVTTGSTDTEAYFRNDAIEYDPDAIYAVSITIGGETATSTIVAPDYSSDVAITAPADGATFTPGQALAVAWSYTGTTPGKAVLEVTGSSQTADESLYEQIFNGTTQSTSIAGTETTTWSSYDDVFVGVGVGVTQTWSGDLAAEGSYSFVLLSMDAVTIHPTGGATTWTVTVTAADPSIETGATTTITVAVEDGAGDPPPMGTEVDLSVSPTGAASIAPATVLTNVAGTATATLTAGSSPATVTVTAVAPSLDNASDQASVSITESGGETGTYDINAGFMTAAEDNPAFLAVVHRVDPQDASAMDAVVTVNGTAVPLSTLGSTDDIAKFESTEIAYAASTNYQIVVSLGGKTATSSFTSPSYLCTIELTAPASLSEFTPGVDLEAEWTLTGTNPPHIYITAGADVGDPSGQGYVHQELPGTARAYTIDTSGWAGYEEAAVVVSVDEYYDFTGNLASEYSQSHVNLTLAMALVVAAGSGGDWTVSVDTNESILAPDGADTTTVTARVENNFGQPCPDGTTVTFSIVSGPGTLADEAVQTTGGRASTILTAGTEEGTVTIRAEALGDSDETNVQITEIIGGQYLMFITFPELALGTPTLAPGATTTLHVSLKTALQSPCPDGTEITLSSLTLDQQTDYLTFGDTTLLTSAGEAETTVTAGGTVPLMGIVTLTGETTDVEFIGGTAALFIGR